MNAPLLATFVSAFLGLINPQATAQQLCKDGQRSYFGVCPSSDRHLCEDGSEPYFGVCQKNQSTPETPIAPQQQTVEPATPLIKIPTLSHTTPDKSVALINVLYKARDAVARAKKASLEAAHARAIADQAHNSNVVMPGGYTFREDARGHSQYSGQIRDNQLNGFGHLSTKAPAPLYQVTFDGEFHNGTMGEYGVMVTGGVQTDSCVRSAQYIGRLLGQNYEGPGELIWSLCGEIIDYVGDIAGGQENGIGVATKNGVQTVGVWRNGRLIERWE